jgi:hypothetical protein
MDTETISTLKTVCTAGHASEGYNGDCNARLEQLVDNGLLDAADQPTTSGPNRHYTPTAKGKELFRQLTKAGAA